MDGTQALAPALPAPVTGRRVGPAAALPVLGSVLSLQAGAALAVTAVSTSGAGGLACARLGLAALLLGALLRPRLQVVRRAGLGTVGLLGVVIAADNWLFYLSLQRLALGPVVTLAFLGPLALAAGTARGRRSLVCAVVSAGGVVLLTRGLGERPLMGAGLALLSGAAIAGYIVVARCTARRSADGGPIAAALGVGALALTPVAALDGGVALHGSGLLVAAAIAVLASALPYWLEFRAARVLPSDTFALLLCLEPAMAAGVGRVLLGQPITAAQVLGVVLVVAAGAVATGTSSHRPRHAAAPDHWLTRRRRPRTRRPAADRVTAPDRHP